MSSKKEQTETWQEAVKRIRSNNSHLRNSHRHTQSGFNKERRKKLNAKGIGVNRGVNTTSQTRTCNGCGKLIAARGVHNTSQSTLNFCKPCAKFFEKR